MPDSYSACRRYKDVGSLPEGQTINRRHMTRVERVIGGVSMRSSESDRLKLPVLSNILLSLLHTTIHAPIMSTEQKGPKEFYL